VKTPRSARPLLLILSSAAVALLLLGGVAWIQTRRPPEWWTPPRPDDAAATALAESLERRLTEEVSRVRHDETPWAVRLTEGQLNAWLALRLPRWIDHAGEPSRVESQVNMVDGGIEIGVRPLGEGQTDSQSPASIGVLRLIPELREGALVLTVASAGLGRLSLPILTGASGAAREMAVATAESLLRSMLRGADEAAGGAHSEVSVDVAAVLSGQPLPARWPLGDGRVVELLDLEIRPGELVVQCATRRPAVPQ